MNEREQFEIWVKPIEYLIGSNVIIAWVAARASQPAQEPVTWQTVPRFEDVEGYFDYTPSKETVDELIKRGWQCIPLFTTPQSEASRIAELEAKLADCEKEVIRWKAILKDHLRV